MITVSNHENSQVSVEEHPNSPIDSTSFTTLAKARSSLLRSISNSNKALTRSNSGRGLSRSNSIKALVRSSSSKMLLGINSNRSSFDDLEQIFGDDSSTASCHGSLLSLRLRITRGSSSRQLGATVLNERPKKSVTFVEDDPSVIGTSESYDHAKDVFYSSKQIKKFKSEAERLGDTAWKLDRHIMACIHHCYGFSLQENLTEKDALRYYFNFRVQDDEDQPTTLRGLECCLCSYILDHRTGVVQSILACQTKLNLKGEASSAEVEERLANLSLAKSQKSRRFSRLMGKADALFA